MNQKTVTKKWWRLAEAEKDGMHTMQMADAKKFDEISDESLKSWWKTAADNESEFCVVNGLL